MIQGIIKKGIVIGEQVPTPQVSDGCLLIKVKNSCISAGTEMSGVTNSGKPLIKRAMEQPAQVAKVLNMARSVGLSKTIAKVKGTLDAGNPTGYSISGIVVGVGNGVSHFKVGDHVAAAGAGLANHAEFVDVPSNLVMQMPKGMSFPDASTVTLGGIALQGVRRADLRVGEFCVVTGAGILGLLAVQMLRLSGARVATIDLDENRLNIAKKLGAEMVLSPEIDDIVNTISNWTGGYGADAVLFTAATTSSDPLSKSFQMCKKKGKVVLVGVSGMEINRADLYSKELDFLISTSYGPGRYDKVYEEKGLDYPYAYVRWTENRNMSEYLRLLHTGEIKLNEMIDKTFSIEQVTDAFKSLQGERKPLIVILNYDNEYDLSESSLRKSPIKSIPQKITGETVKVALVGAGGFATSMHLPNMEKLSPKFCLHAVMSRRGHQAKAVANQYGAKYATTDYNEILNDDEVDLILVGTRHDTHASFAIEGLKSGKNVFVEKPLATNDKELKLFEEFFHSTKSHPHLFVGFNRRFSKYSSEIKKYTEQRINPLFINYRMNAGFIPLDHWVHEHGGRIVGEFCHIVDLMTFFIGCRIKSISFENLNPNNNKYSKHDNVTVILKYEDGSVANIQYFAVGSKEMVKEKLEIHFDGKSIEMNDYKNLKGYGLKINDIQTNLSEKGQFNEFVNIHNFLTGNDSRLPIELWDILQTTKTCIEISKNI